MKRRDFIMASAGLAWTTVPRLSAGQTRPCPPPSVSVQGGQTVLSVCGPASTGHPAWLDSIAPGTWGQVAQNTIREVDDGFRSPYKVATTISCFSGGLGYFPSVGKYGTYVLGLAGGHGGNEQDRIYGFDLETRTWSLLKGNSFTSGIQPDPLTGYGPHKTIIGDHYYSHFAGSSGTGKIVQTRGIYDSNGGSQARGMPYPAMVDVAALKNNPSSPAAAGTLGQRWDKWNIYGGWANHYEDIAFEDYNPSPPAGRASRNRIMVYGRWRVTFDGAFPSHPVFRPSGGAWVTPSGWEPIDPTSGPYYGGTWALDPETGISTSMQDFSQGKFPCWFVNMASAQNGTTNAALDTERDVWGHYYGGVLSIADPERPHVGYTLGSMPPSKTSNVSGYSGRYWTATTDGITPSVIPLNTLLYSKRQGGFIMWSAHGLGAAGNNNVYLAKFTGSPGWHGGLLTTGQQPGAAAKYTWSNIKQSGGFNMTGALGMVTNDGYGVFNKAKICRFPDGEEVLLICNSAGYQTDNLSEEGPGVYAFRIP